MKILLCVIAISFVIFIGVTAIYAIFNSTIERHCNCCDRLEECMELRKKEGLDICTKEYIDKLEMLNKKD